MINELEQRSITGDWRSNRPTERGEPVCDWGSTPWDLPVSDDWVVVDRRPHDARLDADLLEVGLRTRYCTEPDCIGRVTARGAVTLCDTHRFPPCRSTRRGRRIRRTAAEPSVWLKKEFVDGVPTAFQSRDGTVWSERAVDAFLAGVIPHDYLDLTINYAASNYADADS